MDHNFLILAMTFIWLVTNFVGFGFTIRGIRHRRKMGGISSSYAGSPSRSTIKTLPGALFEIQSENRERSPSRDGGKGDARGDLADLQTKESVRHKTALWLTFGMIFVTSVPILLAALLPTEITKVKDIAVAIIPAATAVYGTIVGFYFGQKK